MLGSAGSRSEADSSGFRVKSNSHSLLLVVPNNVNTVRLGLRCECQAHLGSVTLYGKQNPEDANTHIRIVLEMKSYNRNPDLAVARQVVAGVQDRIGLCARKILGLAPERCFQGIVCLWDEPSYDSSRIHNRASSSKNSRRNRESLASDAYAVQYHKIVGCIYGI